MKARKNEDEVGRDAVYETTRIHAEKEKEMNARQSFQRNTASQSAR